MKLFNTKKIHLPQVGLKRILILFVCLAIGGVVKAQMFDTDAIDSVINKVLNFDLFYEVVKAIQVRTIFIGLSIAIITLGLNTGFGFSKQGAKNLLEGEDESVFKGYAFFKGLFIILIIGSWMLIAPQLLNFVKAVNNLTVIEGSLSTIYEDIISYENLENEAIGNVESNDPDVQEALYKEKELNTAAGSVENSSNSANSNVKENIEGGGSSSWYGDMTGSLSNIVNMMNPATMAVQTMGSANQIVLGLVRAIVFVWVMLYIHFLLVVAPIAFAWAPIKNFENMIANWFGSFISAGLTMTTLNILDAFVTFTMKIVNESGEITSMFTMAIVNIVFMIFYLMAFKLTKTFVFGQNDVGAAIGKGVALGVAAVAAGFGGAAALKGGGNIGNAMKGAFEATKAQSGNFSVD